MKLLEVGEMITEKDIYKIEKKMNLEFPVEYKKFLLRNNGGMPEDEVEFRFAEYNPMTQEKREQGSDIHYFYSIEEITNIYQNLVCEELIHKNYIPIACDSFGNEILLGSNKDSIGVFFANHEMLNSNDSFWYISKIADTFDDFMNMLRPIEY